MNRDDIDRRGPTGPSNCIGCTAHPLSPTLRQPAATALAARALRAVLKEISYG